MLLAMALFDSYLVVDWSAASAPTTGRDSIWSAYRRDGGVVELLNHPTRAVFEDWFHVATRGGGRLFAGFDFSFGAPAGLAAAIGLSGGAPWEAIWGSLGSLVAEGPGNANNRFEVAASLNARVGPGPGPFWGCPRSRVTATLSMGKAPGFPHRGLEEYRRCERSLRANGLRVFSTWQLSGAGAVGGQSLVGIATLERFRSAADVRVEVWPFTTGARAPLMAEGADAVVLTEVWPSAILLDPSRHAVRDAAQVLGFVDHIVALDRSGELAAMFTPALSPNDRAVVESEEGWVLGAPG